MKLNLTQKQAKLDKIKRYDTAALEVATLPELKELVKGILPGYSKLKKTELLAEIERLCRPNKRTETTDVYVPDWAKQDLSPEEKEVLEKIIVGENYFGITQQLTSDCYTPLMSLDSKYSDLETAKDVIQTLVFKILAEQSINYGSAAQSNNRSKFNNLARALAKTYRDDKNHTLMVMVIPFFISCMNKAFRSAQSAVKIDYATTVSSKLRGEETIEKIDIYPALRHSYGVLQNLDLGEQVHFVDVVFAVMLATGRRTQEVLECSTLESDGQYTLLFGNPAKQKGAAVEYWKDRKVAIPTLLPANWVLKGFEYIRENVQGKKTNTVTKQLERFITSKGYREDGFTKAYRTRSAYVHCAFKNNLEGLYPNSNFTTRDLSGFGAVVLCHSNTDVNTINSYRCAVIIPNANDEIITKL
jgi:hypothetical protein